MTALRIDSPKALPCERRLAVLAQRFLVGRGWLVQMNALDLCNDVYEAEDGTKRDRGWQPLFSVRYGRTPVYRGVGASRIVVRSEEGA
jgi:hypothetical protein